MGTERPRRAEVRAFPSGRRLVTAAMRAGRRMAPMQGLVDVDVTLARLAHVLYDADVRGVPDLTAALHQVKGERAGGSAGSLSEPSRPDPHDTDDA